MAPDRFGALWRSLEPIGRGTDGYHRFSWTYPDLTCREWFAEEAADRGMSVETDGNGNLWAWLGDPALGDAVVTGSHFDSVPGGEIADGVAQLLLGPAAAQPPIDLVEQVSLLLGGAAVEAVGRQRRRVAAR